MTSWVNDHLAGNGSYSCFRTGLEEGDKDIEIMRKGLPGEFHDIFGSNSEDFILMLIDDHLWFCGEHTSVFVALGTVTGAFLSGEAVARRILGAYGIEDKSVKTVKDIAGSEDLDKDINVRGFGDVL
jgi:hypothetical protein